MQLFFKLFNIDGLYKFLKRRFDVIASKQKAHTEGLQDMQKQIDKIKTSVSAIQSTVQAEKEAELSEEALGCPFKSISDLDEALSNPETEKKLLQYISTLDKDKKFMKAVHKALIEPSLLKHCFYSYKT